MTISLSQWWRPRGKKEASAGRQWATGVPSISPIRWGYCSWKATQGTLFGRPEVRVGRLLPGRLQVQPC